jgi:Fe2+ or Zn2+ uptake regulation protein
MSYYNTNNETGAILEQSKAKASTQEDLIHLFFIENRGLTFSPDAVHMALFGFNVPLTSVRRAMTNLTEAGFLEKTAEMSKGQYGKMVHTWKLREM